MRPNQFPDAPASTTTTARCSRCGGDDLIIQWQTFSNGTRHIRVDCRRCGAYVRYAPQTAENVALADAATTAGSAS